MESVSESGATGHFVHISYTSPGTTFVLRLLLRLQQSSNQDLRTKTEQQWTPGAPISDLGLALTTRIQMVEIARSRCERHVKKLREEVSRRWREFQDCAEGDFSFPLENEQDALEMMVDFDAFVFELDSTCDLAHKFTQEFRTLINGKPPPKQDFENLLAASKIGNNWYSYLCRYVRNPLIHDTAPWPTLDVADRDCSDYEFVLLKTNVLQPRGKKECIRLTKLAELYDGFKRALDQLHGVLVQEVATAEKSSKS